MATYYRWRKTTIGYSETSEIKTFPEPILPYTDSIYVSNSKPNIELYNNSYYYYFINADLVDISEETSLSDKYWVGSFNASDEIGRYKKTIYYGGNVRLFDGHVMGRGERTKYTVTLAPGDFVEYVYSTSASAYPNGGAQGDYYYDQRTTVTSPTAPSGLSYPATITTPSVEVTWTAATSNVPDYPVSGYQVDVSTNGGTSWTTAGTPTTNSLTYSITPGVTSIMFRVRAKDSNNQWGAYQTGTASQVLLAPTLTVPQMLMQGQQATINWTAITGADSYTLERKSSADADWTQVYSGANTTFSETAGTWTTVQYRVQAVFDGTPGGWATSAEIPVVSASALVISGQDGDLGTLVNDVPYTISTDTGNQITATITVNGAVIFSGNVGNSTAGVIPVLDLINGAGTIVIEASVTASSGPVSAVRTWTYTKTMMTFPNAGSIAELTKDGKVMWPETLAEAVRIPGGKTLDQVMGFPCQMYTGSYVGTGTFGESNPNELAFPFEPKFVTIIPASQFTMGTAYGLIWTGQPGSPDINNNAFILDGKTLKWYAESAAYQCNSHGMTFYYAALG